MGSSFFVVCFIVFGMFIINVFGANGDKTLLVALNNGQRFHNNTSYRSIRTSSRPPSSLSCPTTHVTQLPKTNTQTKQNKKKHTQTNKQTHS